MRFKKLRSIIKNDKETRVKHFEHRRGLLQQHIRIDPRDEGTIVGQVDRSNDINRVHAVKAVQERYLLNTEDRIGH